MFEKLKKFVERHLDGHLTLGPLTIYGANAMDWGGSLLVRALGVYLCAKPSTKKRGWYFYASPNATPWAAVVGIGPGLDHFEKKRINDRLCVLLHSPRPEIEAEKIWALWGPKPKVAGSATGGESGGGSRDVFNPSTGLFETVAAPDPTPRNLRRFTVPSDPDATASALKKEIKEIHEHREAARYPGVFGGN